MKKTSVLAAFLLLAMGLALFSCSSSSKSSGNSGSCSASSNFCLLPTSCKQPVTFTDPYLKAAVISELILSGNTAFLSGDTVYNQAFCSVYDLSLEGDSISSLGGLENGIYLSGLDLGYNYISDLSPLANLKYMQVLVLSDNTISDVTPLAGLTALQGLDLNDNHVVNIASLASLKNLEILNLDLNSGLSDITALSGMHQPNLQLILDNDNISSLLPLYDNAYFGTGDSLEISDNPLDELSCCTYIPALTARGAYIDDGGYCASTYICP